MTRSPFKNAVLAASYIVGVAMFLYNASQIFGPSESALIPMAMLSLFVFSAALMGFLFFYQPALLFMDGQRKEAADLFLKTLAVFGLLTAAFFVAVFFAS